VDRFGLEPVDLGIRADMLEPFEGEVLEFEASGGTAGKERLANCSRAEHLVWRDAEPGDRLEVRFAVPRAGSYTVELNLCMSPRHGRQGFRLNGAPAGEPVDCYSPEIYWLHPKLGRFDLPEGENVLEIEALEPRPEVSPGNLFGLDYIFLIRQ